MPSSKRGAVDVKLVVPVDGIATELYFKDVQYPVAFAELSNRLIKLGYAKPTGFKSQPVEHQVRIARGKSFFKEIPGGQINIDLPLVQYYNDCFLPVMDPETHGQSAALVSQSNIVEDDEKIEVGGLAMIGFQRTIRVPDKKSTYALPPDMGPFSLYNTGDHVDTLPVSIISKGGIFLGMYQREAMWISFSSIKPCAVKVSVGGINALTGTPRGTSVSGQQDYIALNETYTSQLWLDGISTAPGVVRQFVAVPLGHNLSVEGQVTGKETEGGIQFDVFPLNCTEVEFHDGVSKLDIYSTPRELGIKVGQFISMQDKRGTPVVIRERHQYKYNCLPRQRKYAFLTLFTPCILIRKTNGEKFMVPYVYNATIADVKESIEDIASYPIASQRLSYDTYDLYNDDSLAEYDIRPGATMDLLLQTIGGGGLVRDLLGGIGAGGRISQKINKDPLRATAYNMSKGSRLHVSIINASRFTWLTGLPAPPTPVSAASYMESGYPWYDLYDEHIPHANNASLSKHCVGALSKVKSIGTLLRSSGAGGSAYAYVAKKCAYCNQLATVILMGCGHEVCDECSSGVTRCPHPSCGWPVLERRVYAAVMPSLESMDVDGVEADVLDERIMQLTSLGGGSDVITFMDEEDQVAPLTGGDGRD